MSNNVDNYAVHWIRPKHEYSTAQAKKDHVIVYRQVWDNIATLASPPDAYNWELVDTFLSVCKTLSGLDSTWWASSIKSEKRLAMNIISFIDAAFADYLDAPLSNSAILNIFRIAQSVDLKSLVDWPDYICKLCKVLYGKDFIESRVPNLRDCTGAAVFIIHPADNPRIVQQIADAITYTGRVVWEYTSNDGTEKEMDLAEVSAFLVLTESDTERLDAIKTAAARALEETDETDEFSSFEETYDSLNKFVEDK